MLACMRCVCPRLNKKISYYTVCLCMICVQFHFSLTNMRATYFSMTSHRDLHSLTDIEAYLA